MANITLDAVTELVYEMLRQQDVVDRATLKLAAMAERVKFIQDNLLPNALREVGMMQFVLGDGRTVKVEPNIAAAITDDNWPDAERWLQVNDCDGIIKNQLIAEFDKGQNDAADIFLEIVRAMTTRPNLFHFIEELVTNDQIDWSTLKVDREMLMSTEELPVAEVKSKKNIHHQTLKAFVREQMKQGREVPEDLFSLFITDHVKIVLPK